MTTLTHKHWQAAPGLLSAREAETCLHVAAGETNKMAARAMGIAPDTVKKLLERCMFKLGTYTRTETVTEAIRRGIIAPLLILLTLHNLLQTDDDIARLRSRPRSRITRSMSMARGARRNELCWCDETNNLIVTTA